MMLVPNRALFGQLSKSAETKTDESDIPLSSEFIHHFGSSDTIWETGKVLDLDVSCGPSSRHI
jgi:hypothetical protein